MKAVVILLALVGIAASQSFHGNGYYQRQRWREMFQWLDVNQDGRLSMDDSTTCGSRFDDFNTMSGYDHEQTSRRVTNWWETCVFYRGEDNNYSKDSYMRMLYDFYRSDREEFRRHWQKCFTNIYDITDINRDGMIQEHEYEMMYKAFNHDNDFSDFGMRYFRRFRMSGNRDGVPTEQMARFWVSYMTRQTWGGYNYDGMGYGNHYGHPMYGRGMYDQHYNYGNYGGNQMQYYGNNYMYNYGNYYGYPMNWYGNYYGYGNYDNYNYGNNNMYGYNYWNGNYGNYDNYNYGNYNGYPMNYYGNNYWNGNYGYGNYYRNYYGYGSYDNYNNGNYYGYPMNGYNNYYGNGNYGWNGMYGNNYDSDNYHGYEMMWNGNNYGYNNMRGNYFGNYYGNYYGYGNYNGNQHNYDNYVRNGNYNGYGRFFRNFFNRNMRNDY
uniref:EF-hand domain-containing protein n=1 Tax=Pinctada fucata TaxID=50426 RepID=A0A194AJ93_PINFU